MSELQTAIYAWVSSERQASEHTIASQVAALENRVAADGLRLLPELRFIDDGYSGSTLLRPAPERLRDAAAAGQLDRLYVNAPDRLARSYAHQVLLVDELRTCDVELVDGQEAHRLAPFFEGDDVLAAAHCPGDVYIEEPVILIRAYLDAAERLGVLGVSMGNGVRVTGITVWNGWVKGVETTAGPVAAPIVVDAAGVWARLVGYLAGADVPLSPVRHQLSITTPIAGIEAAQPIVRVIDAAIYVRPARGGLMLGGFEAEPLAIDRMVTDPSFEMSRLPLDMEVLDHLASMVERDVPALRDASVAEHRGGGFTMTPDGRFLVSPVPGVHGFWTATGCNGSGSSSSPALGDILAEWIVDGTPSLDLAVLSPQRFSGTVWSDDDLNRRGTWQYAHYCDPEASKPAAAGS